MCEHAEWKIIFALLVGAVGSIAFYQRRGLRYLQYFQQQEYEGGRFAAWYLQHRAFDRRGSSIALVSSVLAFMLEGAGVTGGLLPVAFYTFALIKTARQEDDPTTQGKITLKVTERAKRIFNISFVLFSLLVVASAFAAYYLIDLPRAPSFLAFQILLMQLQAFMLVAANGLLMPREKRLQERFADEARAIIKRVHPKIIGITGSYGKTSTKVILADILSAVGPTFSTPRSINSYMGMTREIRERMKESHRFAVVEMGAYYIGSIRRMCSLTPPDAGIVTAVGGMHLERFGSPENVFKAKSELAEAIPEDGILVVNGDNEYCRKMAENNRKDTTLLYGLDAEKGHLDALMTDITQTSGGTSFTIVYKGTRYGGQTKLLGRPMLSNILASFTMACALGLNPELVIAAIRHVKTESNRLEPIRASISSFITQQNGRGPARTGQVLRLNDAYNSNPIGFQAALDVLKDQGGGRKVLVTPGMIELGERQFEENRKAAEKAASICDLVIVVGSANRKALLEGLTTGGSEKEKIKECSSMKEAFEFLGYDFCEDGDVILIENDLPDLYESVPTF